MILFFSNKLLDHHHFEIKKKDMWNVYCGNHFWRKQEPDNLSSNILWSRKEIYRTYITTEFWSSQPYIWKTWVNNLKFLKQNRSYHKKNKVLEWIYMHAENVKFMNIWSLSLPWSTVNNSLMESVFSLAQNFSSNNYIHDKEDSTGVIEFTQHHTATHKIIQNT